MNHKFDLEKAIEILDHNEKILMCMDTLALESYSDKEYQQMMDNYSDRPQFGEEEENYFDYALENYPVFRDEEEDDELTLENYRGE